jgi:uncharacterized peroxidase-related enzyme
MTHHGESLRRLVEDDALVAQLEEDFAQAGLSPEDEAMLGYVEKQTREPSTVAESDVEALREAGFSDRAILDIAQITAYFAFVTRMAAGLGVTLETFWSRK